MKKKAIERLIAAVLVATLAFTGCGAKDEGASQTGEATKQEEAAQQTEDTTQQAESTEQQAKDEATLSDELKERFDTEQPWINSNVLYTVRDADYNPDLKDDFYVAVNREWMMETEPEPGYARTDSFADLGLERSGELRALMTDESITGEDAEKCRNLYNLILDWDARNSFDSVAEIKKHTEPVENIKTLSELSDYLTSEECLYYGNTLFGADIDLDRKNAQQYSVILGVTTLSLSDAAEYKALTDNGERTKEAADETAKYMLERIGYEEDEAQALIDAKYRFEEKIADYEMTLVETRSPDAVELRYNPVTTSELSELAPEFPIVDILKTMGFSESKYINLQEPEWLKGLNSLYTEDNLEDIKAYMICNIASGYIELIDEAAYRKSREISMKRLGTTESASDEEEAYDYVAAALSSSVSRLFVQEYMTEETKQEITEIISDAVAYYRDMLGSVDWLSEETRNKAVEKLDSIKINPVYPDNWRDQSDLVILTKDEGETLLSAVDKINRFNWDVSRSLINTKLDSSYWAIENVAMINCGYAPSLNSIYILAGILGDDFYNKDMSIEEKYGAIGAAIGHELSHAFDTNGAQFDKDGNVQSWWTDEDYATFKERADKLIAYMSSITVDESGNNYNGELVQTETIADMAGVKCMLGLASQIDGFDYDKFFRSYARMWKSMDTKEFNDYRIASDVHALSYIRVNAVLQQYDEFYETYDIKEGDGMYLAPEDRVAVW